MPNLVAVRRSSRKKGGGYRQTKKTAALYSRLSGYPASLGRREGGVGRGCKGGREGREGGWGREKGWRREGEGGLEAREGGGGREGGERGMEGREGPERSSGSLPPSSPPSLPLILFKTL